MLWLRGFTICLLWSVLESHSFWSHNVFFENTNRVHTSRATWKLTLIQDLSQFPQAISGVSEQVNTLLKEVKAHLPRIKIPTPSRKTESLQLLSTDIRQLIMELTSLQKKVRVLYGFAGSSNRKRERRSLFPFIGQAASYLFGTVSKEDLALIKSNLHHLSTSQNKLAHVVQHGLTLMNISRAAINENRQTLNSVIDTITEIRNTYHSYSDAVQANIGSLRAYVHLLFRCLGAVSKARSQLQRLQDHFYRIISKL